MYVECQFYEETIWMRPQVKKYIIHQRINSKLGIITTCSDKYWAL